jgi:hypothetical protein
VSRAAGFLSGAYRCLLRLHPAGFRTEFGAEMEGVFAQAVADATEAGRGAVGRLCLRELLDMTQALACEWAGYLRDRLPWPKGGIMTLRLVGDEAAPRVAGRGTPAPWGQAILAAAALLVPGLAGSLRELPALQVRWPALVFGSYLFILLGLLAGWVRGFPRWSYAYAGYGLLFALYLSGVTTPELRLLGYTFQRHEPWGWRAWLGLTAVAVLALLLTRSLRPLGRILGGTWRDATRLSLALYGTLPLVAGILFDEVRAPYPAPFLALSTIGLAAGALAHMRASATLPRMAALLAGLTASWLVITPALALYWHGRRVGVGAPPLHWTETVMPMALAWIMVSAALLLPALVGWLGYKVGSQRAA